MSRLRSLVRRSAIDVTALRESAPFRRVFTAQFVSQIGSQVTVVALFVQVYELTDRSTFHVGLLGAAQILPLMVFSLAGGAIADAMDRRRLLLLVQVGMFAVAVALALLALGTPPLWSLYVLAALNAAFVSLDGPVRTAVLPMLVDESTLRSAVQLREVLTQAGRSFGPIVGGLLLAHVSFAAAYALDALTFVFAFAMFVGLPRLMPLARRHFELSSITEGLRYVGTNRVLACTFVADLVAMVFGMPRVAFPEFGTEVFHTDKTGIGILFAAPAAGALVGLLFVGGLTSHVRREGLGVLVSVALWGLAIAAFAVTPWFWAAVALLAFAGAADMVSAIFRQTILLSVVPDELRGRMSSVHIMVVTGGPPVGDIEAGAAADLVGLRPSVVFGGLACVAGVVALGAAVPEFRRYVDPARTRTAG